MKLTTLLVLFSISGWSQNCSMITVKIDKFDSSITKTSPIPSQCVFVKKINKNGDTLVALRLTAIGRSLTTDAKGLIILFANGTRIEHPELKIKPQAGEGSEWKYTAFLKLSAEEIAQLMNSPITDYRLYIYDSTVTKNDGKDYQNILNCIVNM